MAKQRERFVQLLPVPRLRVCGAFLHFTQMLVNLFFIKQAGNFSCFTQRDVQFESLLKPALGYSRSKFITGSAGVNAGQETQLSQILNSAYTRWDESGTRHVNVWPKTSLSHVHFLAFCKTPGLAPPFEFRLLVTVNNIEIFESTMLLVQPITTGCHKHSNVL